MFRFTRLLPLAVAAWLALAVTPPAHAQYNGKLTFSGLLLEGQTLTMASDPEEPITGRNFPADFTFQWYRVNNNVETAISGATSITYTLRRADVNKYIRAKATGQRQDRQEDRGDQEPA